MVTPDLPSIGSGKKEIISVSGLSSVVVAPIFASGLMNAQLE